MRILFKIIFATFFIAAVSMFGATAWVMYETSNRIQREATASADRVVREAQALAWRELTWRGSEGRYAKYAFPDWRNSDTLRVIAPGYCVDLTWSGEPTRRTCSGSAGLGRDAPSWFIRLYEELFGRPTSVTRSITLNRKPQGVVEAIPEWPATTKRVWDQVSVVFVAVSGMTICICLMSSAVVGYVLFPATVIVKAVRRLESEDYTYRIPVPRSSEFGPIARAVNDLRDRLLQSTLVRAELTKKLFMAHENERIVLARDLHDEFGQCLTATGALASAIIATVQPDRPEVVADARSIKLNVARMMNSLKICIARLRPPEIEELGLMGSLSTLVTRWNAQNSSRTTCELAVSEGFVQVDKDVAICIYRITQECLTNASKHGNPSRISISLSRYHGSADRRPRLELTVEDDGGGHPDDVRQASGHGVQGIRERLSTLGGDLAFETGKAGLRVHARVPIECLMEQRG